MPPAASASLTIGFMAVGVALALVAVTCVGVAAERAGFPTARRWRWMFRTGALAVLWMGLWWRLAAARVLSDVDRQPPPVMLMLAAMLGASVAVAMSSVGRVLATGLPLAALVFIQVFRVPLELLMHRAYLEGVMPVQMSYSGSNFDIISGLTAVPAAWWLARGGSRLIAIVWNVVGAALLANILIIAVRSTPVFASYGPDRLNTWVMYPPFVWLPAVMVFMALTGHLLLTRALLTGSRKPDP